MNSPIKTHQQGDLTNAQEKALFEYCAGNTISEIEATYDINVFLETNTIKKDSGRYISVYACCNGIGFDLKTDTGRAKMQLLLSDNCASVCVPNKENLSVLRGNVEIPKNIVIVRRYNISRTAQSGGEQWLAFLGDDDNLYFRDFIHNGNVLKEAFAYVLKDAWGEPIVSNDKLVETMEGVISGLDPKIITRVEVDVVFDKDEYIRQAKEEVGKTLIIITKSAEAKNRSLTKQLEREREVYTKRLVSAEAQSFISGINSVKNTDWKVKKGRLVYKHKIIAKRIKLHDRIIETECDTFFVDGLSLTITPNPANAGYTDAYHPNVSGQVCIGDLAGHPLSDVMEKLPSALETCALNSPHEVPATMLAKKIYHWEILLEEEGKVKVKSKKVGQWVTSKGKKIATGEVAPVIPARRRTASVAGASADITTPITSTV